VGDGCKKTYVAVLDEYYTAISHAGIKENDQESERNEKGQRSGDKMNRGHDFDRLYVRHDAGHGDYNNRRKL
jgi:hypothetical protein